MNNKTNFEKDLEDSMIFSKEVLLPLYYSKNQYFKSTEIVDVNGHYTYNQMKSLQNKGVDTFSTLLNDKVIVIDEKVQFSTKDKPWYLRSTQVLELISSTITRPRIGWFLKENLTSHYLFITYFNTFKDNKTIPNGCYYKNEIIESIEGILISKEIIHKMLNDYGITETMIQEKLQQAINNNFEYTKDGRYYIHLNDANIKIVKTNNYKEHPINLVVKLSLYEKYASESFRIFYDSDKEEYVKISKFRREQYYGVA